MMSATSWHSPICWTRSRARSVRVTADGAYDGETVYDEVLQRHPAARVIIPPRSTAVLSKAGTMQRDEHLRSIQNHGRMGWQRRSGYGRRSLVETAMYRYKTIIGRRLHARTLPNQKTEAKIACNALNRMTGLGMPISRPYQIRCKPE